MDEAEGVFAAARGVFGLGEGAFTDDGSDSEVFDVRHGDFEAAQVDGFSAGCAPPIEEHQGLPAPVRQDLDVTPAHTPDACAECLHDGLFGREARGEFGDTAAAVRDLVGRVDALQEAVSVTCQDVGDTVDFDDVDPVGELELHRSLIVREDAASCAAAGRPRLRPWCAAPYAKAMVAQLIDGNAIASEIKAEVAARAAALRARGVVPGLAAVLVGDNAASVSYVTAKTQDCAQVGIDSETFRLPETVTQAEMAALMARLNADARFHAILPQLPLPPQVDEQRTIDAMAPEKDADGLHPNNLGRLLRGELVGAIPCTPNGVVEMLLRSGNDPAGKHVVVVGRSTLVGRPLAVLLSNKARGGNATVTICHTATPDIARYTREADIVVMAAGRANTLTGAMVRAGSVVIDVGVNRVEDASRARGWRLVGDASMDVREVAAAVTPYTGGVGPMTRAMLLVNTVRAAERALEAR